MNDKVLIVGLGNPGPEYATTYHNIGFLAIDHLAEKLGASSWSVNSKTLSTTTEYKNIIFMKPTSFMNESGRSVKATLHYYKIVPQRIVIIHDDSDLMIGTSKCVIGGRSGGHKGVQSIIDALGTQNFWRWRIGFRAPKEQKRKSAGALVLRKISKTDLKKIYGVVAAGGGALIESVIKKEDPSLLSTIDEGGTDTL